MPNRSPISLITDAGTAVFSPAMERNGVSTYMDHSSGVESVSPRLEIDPTPRNANARRSVFRIISPVVSQDDGGRDIKVEDTIIKIDIRTPYVASESEKTQARQLAAKLLEHADIAAIVDDGEGLW